jgi:hypothetical protein
VLLQIYPLLHGTDGVVLDGTYLSYVFKFINIHPATDSTHFTFQASTDSGSNYGITITSTAIDAYHLENDTSPTLQYSTGNDLAQSTSFQNLGSIIGNGNDDNLSGTLQIFNPSSQLMLNIGFVEYFNLCFCYNYVLYMDYLLVTQYYNLP